MIRIRKPVDKSRYYIHKEDLLKAVLEYQAAVKEAESNGKEIPRQPDVIGRYIWDLCEGLGTRYNFVRYSYVDMMKDEAIEQCVKAVLKFNYEKMKASKTMNIFNYFTTVAWRAFQARIIEEKKQNYLKHKHFQYTFHTEKIEGQYLTDTSNNEYSNRVIEEYEAKHLQKKPVVKKVKPKGVEVFLTSNNEYKNVRSKETPLDSRSSAGQSPGIAKRKSKTGNPRKLRRPA